MTLLSLQRSRRRAMTLVEIVIAVMIMIIVGSLVMGAMIHYARVMKGVRVQNSMQRQATLFYSVMDRETTVADSVEVPSATRMILRGRENELYEQSAGIYTYRWNFVTTELIFNGGPDNNLNTFNDNRITIRRVVTNMTGTEISRTERILLTRVRQAVDPVTNQAIPVFRLSTSTTAAPHILFTVRMGDPPDRTNADDRYTGIGHQGFVLRSVFTPGSRIT